MRDKNNEIRVALARHELARVLEQRRRVSTLTDGELAAAGLRSRDAAVEQLDAKIRENQERVRELWNGR